MDRKFLESLGLEASVIDRVMAEHGKTMQKIGDERDTLNTENKQLKATLKDRDGQLEALKTGTGDVDALRKQIEALQTDNKTKDETHAAELNQLKVDMALDKALSAANVKNPLTVKPLLKLDKPVVAEDGSIKGLADQLKALSEAEDTKFLFNTQAAQQNQFKGFVPAEKKDDSGLPFTRDGLKNLTPQQIADNWDAVEKILQTTD